MVHAFFLYKQHFYKQRQAEIGKNQAKAKQHPEAEFLLFENFSSSLSTLSSKTIGHILKNKQRNKCTCVHEIVRLKVTSATKLFVIK